MYRIKPTESSFSSMAYEITSTSLTLSDNHPKVKQRGGKAGREDTYTYTFGKSSLLSGRSKLTINPDKLLEYPSTTPELYADKVAPLINKAMNGFNSTIFAYGQTGSGKSFTMVSNILPYSYYATSLTSYPDWHTDRAWYNSVCS